MFPNSHFKIHLLSSFHERGSWGEIIFIALIALLIIALKMPSTQEETFKPYLYDWEGYYQEGLLDGKEWKEKRFSYF